MYCSIVRQNWCMRRNTLGISVTGRDWDRHRKRCYNHIPDNNMKKGSTA